MPNQVVHIKNIGDVTFSMNRRSKNIKLSIKPDKSILVSYPFYVSNREVMNFVLKNESWIRQQKQKMTDRKKSPQPGSEINTKLYTVQFFKGDTDRVSRKGQLIRIVAADFNSESSQDFIDDCLAKIYRFEARQILPKRLKELAQKFGFKYGRVTIRDNRRNWGSCSGANNISLNLQMMKLPDELIDYILLHELVHTEIKNHGPQFWVRLDTVCENRARELSREVKKYSTYTL